MTIKQLSIFLENKSGRLTDVFNILGEKEIHIKAVAIADTSDFGILRMIVSEPENALKILKDNNFAANITDVISIAVPSNAGSFSKALKLLSDENISIEYMYAFTISGKSALIISTNNWQKTLVTFQKHKLDIMDHHDLFNY